MIGKVEFPTPRGDSAEAILDEAGRWSCPRLPVIVRVLDTLYTPRHEGADLRVRGPEQLRAAARWLKGTVRA